MLAELEKLEANLGGVAEMRKQPDAVFIVDLRKEQLAVREARRLGLPVVALVDTNCDPDDADLVVPGNDDAISSCTLVARVIADGIAHGQRGVSEQELAARNGQPPDEAPASTPADAHEEAVEEYGSETAALAEEALGEPPATASVPPATGDTASGEPGGDETATAGDAAAAPPTSPAGEGETE